MTATRDKYHAFRRKFEPQHIRLVIIAESPPKTGKYFYNPAGVISEPLCSALMQQLGVKPTSKEEGLREFQQRGWILVDATYTPVDGIKSHKQRNDIILGDYPRLRADLEKLLPDKAPPVIVIKANVCRLLQPLLVDDGFNVSNKNSVVYFPSNGRQPDFHRQFAEILKSVS
jgi:hypothetical protein